MVVLRGVMVGMAGNAEESSLSPSSQGVFKCFHLFLFENVPMLEGKPDRDKCHVIYLFNHLCLTMSAPRLGFSLFCPSCLNTLCLPHVTPSHLSEGAPLKLRTGWTGSSLPAFKNLFLKIWLFLLKMCRFVFLWHFMFIIHSLIWFAFFSLDLYDS